LVEQALSLRVEDAGYIRVQPRRHFAGPLELVEHACHQLVRIGLLDVVKYHRVYFISRHGFRREGHDRVRTDFLRAMARNIITQFGLSDAKSTDWLRLD